MIINEDYLDSVDIQEEYSELLPEFKEFLDNVTTDVLERIYVRYDFWRCPPRFGNMLMEAEDGAEYPLLSDRPKSYEPELVCKCIKEVYPIEVEQTQIVTAANNIKIIMLLANIKNNADLIIKDMDFCGWYVAR